MKDIGTLRKDTIYHVVPIAQFGISLHQFNLKEMATSRNVAEQTDNHFITDVELNTISHFKRFSSPKSK